ncbi:MAG TPA: hypothetical protein VG777_02680, partial [Thermoanaerobaculia bacterium]|nr:hypothetical protein [Thermoanaerobaculia bacterium]
KLPFRGAGTLAAALHGGKDTPLRVAGRASFPRLQAANFGFTDVDAVVAVDAAGLTANIERAGFDGGEVEGALTIARFDRSPQDFSLVVDARGVSIERFFADIDLPDTRLAGAADVSVALRWRGGDIDKADGGARLDVAPAGAGVPVSGGGPIAVRRGFLDFENVVLRFPQTSLALQGGFALGVWAPRFRFSIASQDFRALDTVATNFSRAISRRAAAPFGLAGAGTVEGTFGGTWGDPAVSAKVSAENAEYGGLRLGTVYADISVADRAFDFHPLRSYDGDSRLALTGIVRYAPKRGSPDFDVRAEAGNFPVERLLRFFSLDFPVTGRVTGTLPVTGTKNAMTGAGDMVLENASVWGQPVDHISGRLELAPGTFALAGIRGRIGDAMFGGEGSYTLPDGRFAFRLSADNVPLARVALLAPSADEVDGEVSFHAEGSGTIDRPTIQASLQTRRFRLAGRAVPDDLAPSATLSIDRGTLALEAGAAGRWTVRARGPLIGRDRRIDVSAAVPDLSAAAAIFPGFPRGLRGEIAAAGAVDVAPDRWEVAGARLTVSRLRLATESASLAAAAPFDVGYAGGRITIDRAAFEGPGTRVDASLSIDTTRDGALAGTVRIAADAGNLERLTGSDASL